MEGDVLQIVTMNLPYIVCKNLNDCGRNPNIVLDTRAVKFIAISQEFVKTATNQKGEERKMKEAQENENPAMAHAVAEDILCELLRNLGYADVVEEWDKVERWYA